MKGETDMEEELKQKALKELADWCGIGEINQTVKKEIECTCAKKKKSEIRVTFTRYYEETDERYEDHEGVYKVECPKHGTQHRLKITSLQALINFVRNCSQPIIMDRYNDGEVYIEIYNYYREL